MYSFFLTSFKFALSPCLRETESSLLSPCLAACLMNKSFFFFFWENCCLGLWPLCARRTSNSLILFSNSGNSNIPTWGNVATDLFLAWSVFLYYTVLIPTELPPAAVSCVCTTPCDSLASPWPSFSPFIQLSSVISWYLGKSHQTLIS